jgi:DHA2 family multidrug resistance protein
VSASPPKPLPPLTGGPLIMLAIALAVATFMQVLDTTIANVSVPTIAGDLGVSADQGTWVITAFAVSNGVALPLTGWLMQRFGVVRTFSVSVVLFTIASLMCGLAWNFPTLIIFRAIQGAVCGPMIPGSQTLLMAIFPPERRGTALAIWSITTLIAPIFGPILGGYISDNYTWPWIFLINVPIGILAATICWYGLRSRETPTRVLPVDKIGFLLLLVWVGALQVMLDRGKDADWFSSNTIIALAITSFVAFIAWIIWEKTEAHPIVDITLFASRNFAFGTAAYCLGYGLFFGNLVLLPLWLQTQQGYTATWAGLVAAPSGVVAVTLTPFVARLMGKIDTRISASIALVAFAASYFLRSLLTPDAGFWDYVMPNMVMGLGMSMFFVAMITLCMSGLPPARIPAASGLTNFARITAGSFAASLTTTVWDRREALHQSHLTEAMTHFDSTTAATLEGLEHAGLTQAQSLAAMTQMLIQQAYVRAAVEYFWLSGWLCLGLIPIVWATRRAMTNAKAVAAAD